MLYDAVAGAFPYFFISLKNVDVFLGVMECVVNFVHVCHIGRPRIQIQLK